MKFRILIYIIAREGIHSQIIECDTKEEAEMVSNSIEPDGVHATIKIQKLY